MSRLLRSAAILLATLALPAEALGCEPAPGGRAVPGAAFTMLVQPDPAPISLNAPFALDIRLCDGRMAELPGLVRVDAWMPAHRHGMNYVPTLAKLDWAHFRAEGLVLHMPGEWEFVFEFAALNQAERLTFVIDLP